MIQQNKNKKKYFKFLDIKAIQIQRKNISKLFMIYL